MEVVALDECIDGAHDAEILLRTPRALVKIIHLHDAAGLEFLARLHHVTQHVFVLVVCVNIHHIEMAMRKTLNTLDRIRPHHLDLWGMREAALHVLVILLLRGIWIVPEMLPVNLAGKAAEILRLVRERVVVSDFEPPIVDEVQFRWLAGIENFLRKIATIYPNLRPDAPLGILLDQVIAISHNEVHCQSPGTARDLRPMIDDICQKNQRRRKDFGYGSVRLDHRSMRRQAVTKPWR